MDSIELDPATYAEVLRDLAQVNRITLAARPTMAFLDRVAADRRRLKLLDVGYGHGDMLRRIARWAKRRNIAVDLVGIDLNPKSASVAQAVTPPDMPIIYRTGDYQDLAGEEFDVILSSLVTHHMTDAELLRFLCFMEDEAEAGWLVNDLHRHRFAYLGYPLLARLMGWHRIVREDGQLSIARAFRPADWQQLLGTAGIDEAQVVRRFPFRLCVERTR
jgi:2-polyprenyl-3-methyl-5-hydroxy-6-metoxy-1,4-benzoquinol methylase